MAQEDRQEKVLKISVVMATFNGARYLRAQLDSILSQSYPIYELIVQDDGSSDQTWQILQEYDRTYQQIHIFRNESGAHGINANFFSAMGRAKGDFIAISDQDDLWEKDKLRLQAASIGDRLLCSGLSVPFSDDGFPVKADMRRPNFHLIRNTYLSQLPGHTMLFRRELLDFLKDGLKTPFYYDWQIACVASAAESVVFVDETLVHFRRHRDAATATAPVTNHLLSRGAWDMVWFSVLKHRGLQRLVSSRFERVLPFLESLPFETVSLEAAKEMSRLQIKRGLVAFFERMAFFVRHSDYIFHTHEPRPLVRLFRAMFFTFSSGYYYRSQLKK